MKQVTSSAAWKLILSMSRPELFKGIRLTCCNSGENRPGVLVDRLRHKSHAAVTEGILGAPWMEASRHANVILAIVRSATTRWSRRVADPAVNMVTAVVDVGRVDIGVIVKERVVESIAAPEMLVVRASSFGNADFSYDHNVARAIRYVTERSRAVVPEGAADGDAAPAVHQRAGARAVRLPRAIVRPTVVVSTGAESIVRMSLAVRNIVHNTVIDECAPFGATITRAEKRGDQCLT